MPDAYYKLKNIILLPIFIIKFKKKKTHKPFTNLILNITDPYSHWYEQM